MDIFHSFIFHADGEKENRGQDILEEEEHRRRIMTEEKAKVVASV